MRIRRVERGGGESDAGDKADARFADGECFAQVSFAWRLGLRRRRRGLGPLLCVALLRSIRDWCRRRHRRLHQRVDLAQDVFQAGFAGDRPKSKRGKDVLVPERDVARSGCRCPPRAARIGSGRMRAGLHVPRFLRQAASRCSQISHVNTRPSLLNVLLTIVRRPVRKLCARRRRASAALWRGSHSIS